MFVVAMVPIWFWRNMAALAYRRRLGLLVMVELFGTVGMGAQRWIDLGFMRLQPSELMKITLVMVLAAYYDWLPMKQASRPLWVILPLLIILAPTVLVLKQPDLGTAILLVVGGGVMMFLAGRALGLFRRRDRRRHRRLVTTVFKSRGTDWQLLKDYQFRRIDTFLDPASDPLGAGYHITQSKIALGSGGWTGRGFMQGTQSRLNFLPEKHTDFIFTTLAEEFGFVGGLSLLALYVLIIALLHRLGDPEPGPLSLPPDARDRGDLLPVLRGEHVDGDGPRPRGGRAAAAGELRRLGDAGPHGRLRPGPERAYPQAAAMTLTILFAAGPEMLGRIRTPAAGCAGRDRARDATS